MNLKVLGSDNEIKGLKLTVGELDTCIAVLNFRNPQGNLIKDLRLINQVVDSLDYVRPAPPIDQSGDAITEEETVKLKQEYATACEAYPNTEISIVFNNAQLTVLKIKLSQFNGFFSDPIARKQTIALADKLGI